VLGWHLGHVSAKHSLIAGKKARTINDLDPMPKDADVIDTPTWRSIQLLGDLRNRCGHSRDRDPFEEETNELVSGAEKAIKLVL
jgi:hypothetical protein